jgi:exosortase/archaeosortase family protein
VNASISTGASTALPTRRSTNAAGRWQARFDTLPPLAWLALQAAALWPHWLWAAARVADGSDDPLGLAALAALACAVWRLEPSLRGSPRPAWLALALVTTVAATAAALTAPPLLGALLAALALAAGLRAFMPAGHAMLPLAGLAVLALPVVSSLQFYAGFPLRVVTAQLSTWWLQAIGLAAQRSGTAMVVEGRLIIVDAPCSGVQMVWMAYFCACAVAVFSGTRDSRFLRRLAWVGVLVLFGNVLRNSVLVALEATQPQVSEAIHQGVGLVVLAAVCAAVVAVMRGVDDARA